MALFEFGDYSYQEITLKEKLLEVLSYLLRIGDFKQYAGKTILNNVYMDLRGKKPVFKRTKTAITEIKLRSAQSLHIKLFILLMIVSFTEPLEVVFMMLIISVMRQNVTILLPVIMHCHRRRWKFIVILDAKPMSSIVKRKHRILPYLWQCYVRKQLLHKTFVILYRFVHCNHMWKVLLSYFKKFVLREK